jgi:quercetin dioxygenase-like cupin family protein
MINTDAPGVTVEVTATVPVTNHAAQVRLQSWAQRFGDDDGDGSYDRLIDLRFTPDQAEDLAAALATFAHQARIDNHHHPRLEDA